MTSRCLCLREGRDVMFRREWYCMFRRGWYCKRDETGPILRIENFLFLIYKRNETLTR